MYERLITKTVYQREEKNLETGEEGSKSGWVAWHCEAAFCTTEFKG